MGKEVWFHLSISVPQADLKPLKAEAEAPEAGGPMGQWGSGRTR